MRDTVLCFQKDSLSAVGHQEYGCLRVQKRSTHQNNLSSNRVGSISTNWSSDRKAPVPKLRHMVSAIPPLGVLALPKVNIVHLPKTARIAPKATTTRSTFRNRSRTHLTWLRSSDVRCLSVLC
ncbi:unnamed protein product [Sphagnum balticum]